MGLEVTLAQEVTLGLQDLPEVLVKQDLLAFPASLEQLEKEGHQDQLEIEEIQGLLEM